MDDLYRVCPVRKAADVSIAAGADLFLNDDGMADTAGKLFGVADSVALTDDDTVDARIPCCCDADLKQVQLVGTPLKTADGRPIVQPICVLRKRNEKDKPTDARCPVKHMKECVAHREEHGEPETAIDWTVDPSAHITQL